MKNSRIMQMNYRYLKYWWITDDNTNSGFLYNINNKMYSVKDIQWVKKYKIEKKHWNDFCFYKSADVKRHTGVNLPWGSKYHMTPVYNISWIHVSFDFTERKSQYQQTKDQFTWSKCSIKNLLKVFFEQILWSYKPASKTLSKNFDRLWQNRNP